MLRKLSFIKNVLFVSPHKTKSDTFCGTCATREIVTRKSSIKISDCIRSNVDGILNKALKLVRGKQEQNERKPLKRPIEMDSIDNSLIQINVSSEEMQRRIQSFIERKREQVNINNIQDFIPGSIAMSGEAVEEETCARIRSLFAKRSDSKGHLKIHRVNNEWGPQTLREPVAQKKMEIVRSTGSVESGEDKFLLPAGIQERVTNVEKYLSINPVGADIYKRLKVMEDKLAHLESISPEYALFWPKQMKQKFDSDQTSPTKVQYLFTAEDITRKIEEMEKQTTVF